MQCVFVTVGLLLLFVAQIQATCTACRSCNEGGDLNSGLCKCDGNCILYEDCCIASFNLSNCTSRNNVPNGLEFTCRSIYPNDNIVPADREAFWMVSNCPSSWSPDEVSQACMSGNCASLNSSLPPVTDLNTGIVYFNEYYAICNGAQTLSVWQPNLACTSYVYEQIAEIGVQALFAMDPIIFQTQCQTCSYQMPTGAPSPRPCTISISSCLDLFTLNDHTRQRLNEEMYNRMVDACERGPYDIVRSLSGTHYRNEDCAVCNGVFDYTCFRPTVTNEIPAECAPVSPTTEIPATTVTTKIPTDIPIEEGARIPIPTIPTVFPTTKILPTVRPTFDPTEIPTGTTTIIPNVRPTFIPTEIPTTANVVPPTSNPEPTIASTQTPQVNGRTGIPFTIALSNLGGGQVQVSVESEVVTVMVDCPDGQAALGLECRPTLCPEGYVENGGRCAFLIDRNTTSNTNSTSQCLDGLVALNTSEYVPIDNATVLYNDQILSIVELGINGQPIVCLNTSVFGNFFDCPSSLVRLNTSEFTDLGNDTILYKNKEFAVVEYDDFGRPLICPPNTTTIVVNTTIYSYPEGYFILTYIGCSLSVVGSALVLLTYGLFKSLRTLPSLILMNLSAAILANNLLIIIGGPVSQAFPSVELCTIVAILLHFSFLSQFSWMTVMSFQMARTFYQATKMKVDMKKKYKLIIGVYFVIGWSIPVSITAVSVLVDFTIEDLVQYGVLEDGRQGSCWINHFESAIVSFIVPLVISLLINMILFVVVTAYLCIGARSSSKLAKKQNTHFFRVNSAVFSVTGLTWVFGFIALLAGTSWAWYPFIILNSTQGFVIFIAFILTKRVLRLYYNLLCCREAPDTPKPSKLSDSSTGSVHKSAYHSSVKSLDINLTSINA